MSTYMTTNNCSEQYASIQKRAKSRMTSTRTAQPYYCKEELKKKKYMRKERKRAENYEIKNRLKILNTWIQNEMTREKDPRRGIIHAIIESRLTAKLRENGKKAGRTKDVKRAHDFITQWTPRKCMYNA